MLVIQRSHPAQEPACLSGSDRCEAVLDEDVGDDILVTGGNRMLDGLSIQAS